jgi:hypothetical protein
MRRSDRNTGRLNSKRGFGSYGTSDVDGNPNDGKEEFRWLRVGVHVLTRRKKCAPLLRPNGELGTLILKKEGSGRGEKNGKGPNDGREEFRWLRVGVHQVLTRRKKCAPLLRPNGELGTLILKKEGSGEGRKMGREL